MADQVPEDANEHCPGVGSDHAGKSSACDGCPNQAVCATAPKQAAGPDPDLQAIAERLSHIKHVVLVLSGKGGVGKSTFSAQLAFALASQNREVGLLDIDICGPSVPKMLGLEGEEIHQSNMGWSPVYVQENLGVMSIGFMLPNPDDAVIWRGPRKNGIIKQFLKDVNWGPLDYLIIDSPPGTSDEHISVVQFLQAGHVDGALIVTTPQEVAIADVRKEINFCKKTGIPVLGVVENMSGLRQPLSAFTFQDNQGNDMTDIITTAISTALSQQQQPTDTTTKSATVDDVVVETEVFYTTRGAAAMATDMGVPFLGKVPLDGTLSRAGEEGRSVFDTSSGSNGVSNGGVDGEKVKKTVMSSTCGPALWKIIEQVVGACEGEVGVESLKGPC